MKRRLPQALTMLWPWRHAYAFIAPFFVLYAVFGLYPFLYSFFLSFQRWHGLDEMRFIGLDNYARIVQERLFWRVLGNTLWYWFAIVPLTLVVALGLASLLNRAWLKGRGLLRTLYILPYVTSVVVVSIVFRGMLETNFGAINHYLGLIGIERIPWLQSAQWAKVSVASLVLWKSIGFTMIVYLGGLQTIPGELYEAASIDGASRWQQLMHITAPLLKNITVFLLIIHTIGIFNLFGEPYLLTEGGPEHASTTLTLEIYANGFRYFKIGRAAALSVILLGLIAITSMVQLKLAGARNEA